jgi:spore coat protein U-like protein
MTVKSISSAFALGLMVSSLTSRPALAATPTASFGVSAIVQATCLVSASGVPFETYADAIPNAASTVSVNCTNATPYNISLSSSPSNSAATASTTMAATDSALLRYALASNSHKGVTRGWTLDTDTVAGTGNGSAKVFVVQRNTFAGEHVAANAYAGTITLTIIY